MNFVWGLIIGVGGVALIWAIVSAIKNKESCCLPEGKSNPAVEVKQENLAKLEELISKQARITNDDVQELLGVSDKTATRYLDELESQGKIRQIGGAQKDTYYEKT